MKNFVAVPGTACVTGMIFPAEIETPAQYLIEHAAGFAKGFQRRLFDLKVNRAAGPLYPYSAGLFGSGANMAFDAHILRQTGAFDDALGAGSVALGADDLAAFFQIVTAGHVLVYEPAAIVHHRHHREYAALRRTAYGYGAGLTAFLAKTLIDRPLRIFDFVWRVPFGLVYALSARSPKNARKSAGYPAELTQLERKGMLAGPLLYIRSRWKTRRFRGQALQTARSLRRASAGR